MKKKVVYTSLTGNYDNLLQPLVVDDSFDYICFSNDIHEEKIGIWEIRRIPYSNSDNTRLSRYVKLMPHKVLQDYEYSLWMDANMQIATEKLYDIVNKRIEEGYPIYQVPSPFRDCIYDEIRHTYLSRKVNLKDARKQFKHLKNEGFPNHYGLYENGLILRKHNEEIAKLVSEGWWEEYQTYCHRDQFSLSYVYWMNNFKPKYIFDEHHCARNVDCIIYHVHPRKLGLLKKNKIIRLIGSNLRTALRFVMLKLFLRG